MTATPATKTLKTKTGSAYVTDEGVQVPEHTLMRFEDEDGKGGCWYTSLERAEQSWQRWVAGAPGRERRAAENARYESAIAAHNARGADADPFDLL